MKTHTTKFGLLLVAAISLTGLSHGKEDNPLASSEWGKIGKGLSMRIHSSRVYTARKHPSRGYLDCYFKCEIKNDDSKEAVVMPKGRVFLEDDSGEVIKTLRSSGVFLEESLEPGKTTVWWQHAVVPEEGKFRVSVLLDGIEGKRSPELLVEIIQSKISDEDMRGVRREVLQKQIDKLVECVPNTDEKNLSFRKLKFHGDPIIIEGLLYTGFKFTVPEGWVVDTMDWAFNAGPPENSAIRWGIIPADGSMTGFRHFHEYVLDSDLDTVGEKGDLVVVQGLSEGLTPGKEYVIWFDRVCRNLPELTLSFNILEDLTSFDMIKKNATRRW